MQNLPKSARLNRTLVPMNAGHLSFNAFMIALSMETTAPGFVTRSLRLVGFKKLFAAAPNEVAPPEEAAAAAAEPFNACASAATANNSGARFLVNLSGNVVTNFCRNEGR